MKILRKNDTFKKMPDSDINDIIAIKDMIDYGWVYCSKREYKDFFSKTTENKQESNTDSVDTSKKLIKKEKTNKK